MHKAYSSVAIKSIDEDQRVVIGVASTPAVDLVGDIVEPMGMNNLSDGSWPFMVDHDHTKNVGRVEMVRPTKTGLEFRARVARPSEPSAAADLCRDAWAALKAGLRPGISIGFSGIDVERLPTGGAWFKSWRLHEISAVSVACQPQARVLDLKSAPGSRRLVLAKPRFKSAAMRREARGIVILDERTYVRRARAAMAHFLGENKVPYFRTLKALEAWDDDRQRMALARGATSLPYEFMMGQAPMPKAIPVVRLR